MATARKCIICHKNPPEVPDRNRMGRPIKRVCLACHQERLREDLLRCMMVPSKYMGQGKHHTATNLRALDEKSQPGS